MVVALALISAASFLYYGTMILISPRMQVEFDRYGQTRLRKVVGVAELLGGAGALIGLAYPPLGALAAACLAVLMILGVATRISIGDRLRQMLHAATLALLNAALAVLFINS